MKTALLFALVFISLVWVLPGYIRRKRMKRERKSKEVQAALELIEEAGLTAYSKKAEEERSKKLDGAVKKLKEAGYTITKT